MNNEVLQTKQIKILEQANINNDIKKWVGSLNPVIEGIFFYQPGSSSFTWAE